MRESSLHTKHPVSWIKEQHCHQKQEVIWSPSYCSWFQATVVIKQKKCDRSDGDKVFFLAFFPTKVSLNRPVVVWSKKWKMRREDVRVSLSFFMRFIRRIRDKGEVGEDSDADAGQESQRYRHNREWFERERETVSFLSMVCLSHQRMKKRDKKRRKKRKEKVVIQSCILCFDSSSHASRDAIKCLHGNFLLGMDYWWSSQEGRWWCSSWIHSSRMQLIKDREEGQRQEEKRDKRMEGRKWRYS